MNIKITGKELKATDAIKNYIDTKAERIEKYFDTEDINLFVTIKKEGGDQVAEMQISVNGESFRAVTASNDLYASIDMIIDKLERMIRKNKTRLNNHYKNVPSFEMNLEYEETLNEEPDKIIKRKNLDTKPMDEDEAIMQMELLNHDFFTFKNINEECVSVLYKRKDGSLGIINVK